MKNFKIILISIAFIYNNLPILGQTNIEMGKILNLSDATQDIGFYVYKHKDYEVQIYLLKQYIVDKNPVVRKNCYLWVSFIGYYAEQHRYYTIETLLEGMKDNDKYVVDICYGRLTQFFSKPDFTEKAISIVKELFYKQSKFFYVLNTYVNTEDKIEKDSCWRVYKQNPIYYDVIKLIGYLEIRELIPDLKQILLNFKGRWGYNYANYPIMDNPIENYAESRIINPWQIHLAFAHMGDTSEISYCINQFKLLVENNKSNPSIFYDPFMKDMVYIMQLQVIPVFQEMLQWADIDEYYLDYSRRCLGNLINEFPYIYDENMAKEYMDWLNSNMNKIKLNRLSALKWDNKY